MAKILVVDDEQLNQELLVQLLDSNQYETFGASDGAEALALARSEHPDLIISDVLMPTMDGYEFIRQLRADPIISQTRVIFISGYYLGREARAVAEANGVNRIIYRPCKKNEILRTVEAALQNDGVNDQSPRHYSNDGDHVELNLAIENLSDEVDELRGLNHKLTALIELSQQLASEYDPLNLLKKYSNLAREILGAKWNAVGLLDEDTGSLEQIYTVGLSSAAADQINAQSLVEGVFAGPIKDGRSCRLRILNKNVEAAGLPPGFPAVSSCLSLPIIFRQRLYGSFCLGDKLGAVEFSETDERLAVTLVGQMGAALENAKLFRESQRRAVDLEEKAQLTARVEQQSLRLDTIIANVPGVVWETWKVPNEAMQQVNFVSDFTESLLGYSVEKWLSTPDFWLSIVHPEDRERAGRLSAEHFATGESYSQEFRWIASDGHIVWVETQASMICGDDGRSIGMRGVNLDISERKEAEEALRVSESELRQSHKLEAIGQLAGGIAHDFNNLLTVITGYSDLALRRTGNDDVLRSSLCEIQKAGDRACSLTNQLLAFSRKQVLQPKVVNLNAIVTNVDKLLRRLIGEDIDLFIALEPKLGQAKADPNQIEQIIMNLAVNARDAMPEGGKFTIETTNVRLDEKYTRNHVEIFPGQYVMLTVSDNGCGMSPEVQTRIFEPFFTTKGLGKGTGLGLSIVYGIVRQSGGNIWAYSEEGKGTTFKIYFPCVDEPDIAHSANASSRDLPQGLEMILLAEDEDQVRRMTRGMLEMNGYRVLDATNGQEALSIFEQYTGQIDLVLTDAVMPKMSGRELVETLKGLNPKIKVLFMSGYTNDAIVRHGLLDQSIAFLEKPFTPDSLMRKLRDVLDAPCEF